MAVNGVTKPKRIVLGSGKLYAMEFNSTMPEDSVLEVDENLLGDIKGGASLEYKGEFYKAESDLGVDSKTVMTKEEASLKSGVITWNGDTVAKLCSTARVATVGTTTTIKIGGLKNHNGKRYVVRFVQEDVADNIILRVSVVGINQNGLILAFAKDKETQVDAVFKAEKHDAEGTLIVITQGELKAATTQSTGAKVSQEPNTK